MADFTYEVGGWGLRIRFGSDAYASYNIYSPHTLYNSAILRRFFALTILCYCGG